MEVDVQVRRSQVDVATYPVCLVGGGEEERPGFEAVGAEER